MSMFNNYAKVLKSMVKKSKDTYHAGSFKGSKT